MNKCRFGQLCSLGAVSRFLLFKTRDIKTARIVLKHVRWVSCITTTFWYCWFIEIHVPCVSKFKKSCCQFVEIHVPCVSNPKSPVLKSPEFITNNTIKKNRATVQPRLNRLKMYVSNTLGGVEILVLVVCLNLGLFLIQGRSYGVQDSRFYIGILDWKESFEDAAKTHKSTDSECNKVVCRKEC
jgi:hypothetical protein